MIKKCLIHLHTKFLFFFELNAAHELVNVVRV